jgi:hypothetical protein
MAPNLSSPLTDSFSADSSSTRNQSSWVSGTILRSSRTTLRDREEMTETTMPTMRRLLCVASEFISDFSSNGSNDKTEDTLADSGMPLPHFS